MSGWKAVMVVINRDGAVQQLEGWFADTPAYEQHLLIHLANRSASKPDKCTVKMRRLADEVDPHESVNERA